MSVRGGGGGSRARPRSCSFLTITTSSHPTLPHPIPRYRPLALAPVTATLPVHPLVPKEKHALMIWEEIVSRRRYLTEALSLELEDDDDSGEPMRINRGKILLRVVSSVVRRMVMLRMSASRLTPLPSHTGLGDLAL